MYVDPPNWLVAFQFLHWRLSCYDLRSQFQEQSFIDTLAELLLFLYIYSFSLTSVELLRSSCGMMEAYESPYPVIHSSTLKATQEDKHLTMAELLLFFRTATVPVGLSAMIQIQWPHRASTSPGAVS